MKSDKMHILGIETSCDETAVAIVRGDKQILAQSLLSQTEDHAPYGGVVPEIAARSHLQSLRTLYRHALDSAGLPLHAIDAIAVTAGPGLIGGVMVGLMFAKGLAVASGLPLIGINHLEGHALSPRLVENVDFPYGLMLLSGGHCQILRVEGVGKYRLIGTTRDDALGEAFDKVAKMLGLGYPGGAPLEALARNGDSRRFAFPRPMQGGMHADFSFSGLKTAVRLQIEALACNDTLDLQTRADVAASFQAAACDVLCDRLSRAAEQMLPLSAWVLAGGVAANHAIRTKIAALCDRYGLPLVVPPVALCTDNAAMIAWAGYERYVLGQRDALNIAPRARWPLVELDVPVASVLA